MRLHGIDLAIILAYFAVCLVIGRRYGGRAANSDDYFKASGRIPWWAAGISMFGAQLSAITYLGMVAKSYHGDWTYFLQIVMNFLPIPIVIYFVLPVLCKLPITTAFEYLSLRFNTSLQKLGALIYVFFQVGRTAVVLLVPAVALKTVAGVDVLTAVLLIGGVSIVLAALGGLEGTVWIEVLNVTTLMVSAFVIVFLALQAVPGGFETVVRTGREHDKFAMLHWKWTLSEPTIWAILLLKFGSISMYLTDQALVQRYLSTRDASETSKGLWLKFLVGLPLMSVLFFAGTAIFVGHLFFPPAEAVPSREDGLLPWFILHGVPVGLTGVVLAAILAAAIGSAVSSLNSLAAVMTVDFRFKLRSGREVTAARWATVIAGVVALALSLMLIYSTQRSIWDLYIGLVGGLTGPLAGVFLLGMIVKTSHARGAWIGFGAAVLAVAVAEWSGRFHVFTYGAIGVLTAFLVGWLASRVAPTRGAMMGAT